MTRRKRLLSGASGLCFAATLLLAPAAGADQKAYISGFDSAEIRSLAVNPDGGLTPLPGPDTPAGADDLEGITVTPDADHLYVVGDGGELFGFRIAASGDLTAVPGSPALIGETPYGVAVTPDGRYVYASARTGDAIFAFELAANGSMKPVAEPSVPQEAPTGLAVTPNGRFLYANSRVDDGDVYAYRIRSNGTLADSVPGSPFPAGVNPYALSLAPDGKHIYSAARDDPALIHAYAVGTDGALGEIAGSPFPTAETASEGLNPFGSVISPSGRNYYTTNYNSDTISAFDIGGSGALDPKANSPLATMSDSPAAPAINATASNLYVAVGSQMGLPIFDLNGAGAPSGPMLSLNDIVGDFQSIALTPAQPPKAKLAVKTKKPKQNKKVRFSAKRSTDDGKIVEYRWKFGDGSQETTMKPKVKHRYAKKGRYKVKVTLTDDEDCSVKYVSSGQTAYCNGSGRANAAEKVKVRKNRRR